MIVIVVLLMLCFKQLAAAAATALIEQICGTNGTYKPKSTYQANLQLLSTALMNASSSAEATPLFAKGSVGVEPDTVYGLALCRGDTANGSACADCVATAFRDAQRLCELNTEAHVLYEACILRFSNQEFVYRDYTEKRFLVFQDTSTDKIVAEDVKVLLRDTAKQAAYSSAIRYATGHMIGSKPGFAEPYSLMQCMPNLSAGQCSDCLDVLNGLDDFTGQHGGVWIAGVWCSSRYTTYQFYQGKPTMRIGHLPPIINTSSTNTTAPPPAPVVVMSGDKHKSKN